MRLIMFLLNKCHSFLLEFNEFLTRFDASDLIRILACTNLQNLYRFTEYLAFFHLRVETSHQTHSDLT